MYPPAAAACMADFPFSWSTCWFALQPSTAKLKEKYLNITENTVLPYCSAGFSDRPVDVVSHSHQ